MKIKFLKWIFFLVLIINTNTMNAQNKSLSAQQQSIVTISALTATGDLKNLKIQLNDGLDEGFPILL